MTIRLLTRSETRRIARATGWAPDPSRGRYFLHDFTAVRAVAAASGARRGDHVLQLAAGIGSLTLALLDKGATVTAVESDLVLARRLPFTVAEHCHHEVDRLCVLRREVSALRDTEVPGEPTIVVASLPADRLEPVLLHVLAEFPSVRTVLVITDSTLVDRLAAPPGDPKYHPCGVKLRYYGTVHRYWSISPSAFWPTSRHQHGVLRVDREQRWPRPVTTQGRAKVFDLIDTAYAHRRHTARTAFAAWAGSGNESAERLLTASIDPSRRAAELGIEDFVRLHDRSPSTPHPPAMPTSRRRPAQL